MSSAALNFNFSLVGPHQNLNLFESTRLVVSFDLVCNLSMFGVVYKKVTFFETNNEKCQFKFTSFCM